MYVFIYDLHCVSPSTCPPSPVLSASRLPPNNKMTRVSLSAVPTFDPNVPGNITINSVQYFDSTRGKQPTFPLAQWSSGDAADTAWVSLRAQRNGAGKGRLYRIQYTASNEVGSCSEVAYLCVPHDASAFDP
ncbi:hypothetical protein COO60DRAFT_44204 [Scenedesmus sp. NREL 46B-D3]|nr:hypothetical protein COO60DRAFT_44204 [Scenedesmus sp. NREL 46B-D3]